MSLISVLTNDKGSVTKKILNKNLDKGTVNHITKGHGQAVDINLKSLSEMIPELSKGQCLCVGAVAGKGTNKYNIDKYTNGEISRSTEFYEWILGESFLELDFDSSDYSPEGALGLLSGICPQFEECGILISYSCSSYLYDTDSGEELSGGKSYHLYAEVSDGLLLRQFGDLLFDRLVLDGYGWCEVNEAGRRRIKSPLDSTAWRSPNREIFEVNPICCDGVESKRLEHITFEEGCSIDLEVAITSLMLSGEEKVKLGLIKSKLKEAVVEESKKKRKEFNIRKAKKKAERKGKPKEWRKELKLMKDFSSDEYEDSSGVTHTYLSASESFLGNDGNEIKVVDVLNSPWDYDKMGLPDPEHPYVRGDKGRNQVGNDIAYIKHNEDDSVHIFSFYYDVEFHLVWDLKSSLEFLDKNSKDTDELDAFVDSLINPECINHVMTDGELQALGKEFSDISKTLKSKSKHGADSRTVSRVLKETRNEGEAKQEAKGNKAVPEFIVELNNSFGACLVGNKAKIIHERYKEYKIGKYVKKVWEPVYVDIEQYKKHHKDQTILVKRDGKVKAINKYSLWEQSPHHNKFDNIVFAPNNELFKTGETSTIQQGGVYNLWQGFIADPDKAKNCEQILWHLKHVWCSDETQTYEYVLKWFAELFQNPGYVGEKFLSLNSTQGAGKNIITDQLVGALLGAHAYTTGRKRDLVGNFNAHTQVNVFTCINEAFFAGDKEEGNFIKTLIDPMKQVEKKGIDSESDVNRTKYIFASNSEWANSVEANERRFVYPKLSNRKAGDANYFKELGMEIENGGREAFLDFMLKHDSTVRLSSNPSGQSGQKFQDFIQTADSAISFLYELCEEGVTWDTDYTTVLKDESAITISKAAFFALYCGFCDNSKMNRKFTTPLKFYMRLGKLNLYKGKKTSLDKREKFPMYEVENLEKPSIKIADKTTVLNSILNLVSM